jgi:hypothetical protein
MTEPVQDRPRFDCDKLVDTLRTEIRGLVSRCLEELDALAKDPEFRADPQAANPYLRHDAMLAFSAHYESVRVAYLGKLSAVMTDASVIRTQGLADGDDIDSLQLVGTEELELNIATTNAAQRAESEHKEALLHIELRLEELALLWEGRLNPLCLHPQALYQPFQDALQGLDLEVQAKILLCEFFDKRLAPRLEALYRHLNQVLADAGILSQHRALKRAIRAREGTGATRATPTHNQPPLDAVSTGEFFAPVDTSQWANLPEPEVAPAAQRVQAAPNPYAPGAESLGTLFNYLHSGANVSGAVPDAARVARSVKTVNLAVVDALTRVQHREAQGEALMDAGSIKDELSHSLAQAESEATAAEDLDWEVSEEEQKIIDFVNQIFQAILNDEVLSDALKALMSRLQIPIIKLALLDFAFFQHPQHPARELLNTMATLGVGIEDKQEPLFKKLQSIVGQITDDFDTDVSTFEEALRQLRRIGLVESEQARENEIETHREALAKAQRSAAKRAVVSTLNRHIKERDLPDEAMQFILKCWAPYMGMIYLREGTESESWNQSVYALRRIIEAAQPERTQIEIEGIIGSAEQFFRQIKEQLTRSSLFHQGQEGIIASAKDWFKELVHKVSNRRAEPTQEADTEPPEEQAPPTLEELLPPEEETPDEQAQVLERLMESIPAEVKAGAWFEIYRGQSRAKRRLKLSAILEDTGQLLFAERTGQGALEVDLEGFLCDLREGRTKLIDDNHRFDRALCMVIDNIRENQERHSLA